MKARPNNCLSATTAYKTIGHAISFVLKTRGWSLYFRLPLYITKSETIANQMIEYVP